MTCIQDCLCGRVDQRQLNPCEHPPESFPSPSPTPDRHNSHSEKKRLSLHVSVRFPHLFFATDSVRASIIPSISARQCTFVDRSSGQFVIVGRKSGVSFAMSVRQALMFALNPSLAQELETGFVFNFERVYLKSENEHAVVQRYGRDHSHHDAKIAPSRGFF